VTPNFLAMGQVLIRQTGPTNSGQICQADTLEALALQMNRRGGIVDAVYAAGAAGNLASICVYYAYEPGDSRNCLHFQEGQGLNFVFGGTAGGAAVWDTLDVGLYAVYADDEECFQLYTPVTSQRQIPFGGTNPTTMEQNLLEFCATQSSTGAANNPGFLQLLTGTTIEYEGTFEGLKRKANAVYPIEGTQTTLQSVLHGDFESLSDIFQMVRTGTSLRFTGGAGTTQLFQRYATFNAVSVGGSIRMMREVLIAKRRKLMEGTEISREIKELALPVISPPPETAEHYAAIRMRPTSATLPAHRSSLALR
jgi:hypothetical protein